MYPRGRVYMLQETVTSGGMCLGELGAPVRGMHGRLAFLGTMSVGLTLSAACSVHVASRFSEFHSQSRFECVNGSKIAQMASACRKMAVHSAVEIRPGENQAKTL